MGDTINMDEKNYIMVDKKTPLTLVLRLKPKQYHSTSISHLQDIVIFIAQQTTLQKVNSAQYEVYDHNGEYIVVYELAYYENPIYVTPKKLLEIRRKFDLAKYYGFRFVSNDPLIYHAINVYHLTIKKLSLSQLFIHNNIVFVRGDDELIEELGMMVDNLKLEGYFNIRNNGLVEKKYVDSVLAVAYLELASLWNMEVISYINPVIIKSVSNIFSEFYTPKSWLLQASQEVIKGKLPIYTLRLPFKPNSYYLKRYRDLYVNYSHLKKYEKDLIINEIPGDEDHRWVTGRFGSSNQVSQYYNLIKNDEFEITNDGISSNPKSGEFWIIKKDQINNNNKEILVGLVGLVVKSEDFISIPTKTTNFMNTHQTTNTLYAKYIPYDVLYNPRNDTIKELNDKWLNGELISDWGKEVLISKGKISRFSLSLNKK